MSEFLQRLNPFKPNHEEKSKRYLEQTALTRQDWTTYANAHIFALEQIFQNCEWQQASTLRSEDEEKQLPLDERMLRYQRDAVTVATFADIYAQLPKYQEIADKLLLVPKAVKTNLQTAFPNEPPKVVRFPSNVFDFRKKA